MRSTIPVVSLYLSLCFFFLFIFLSLSFERRFLFKYVSLLSRILFQFPIHQKKITLLGTASADVIHHQQHNAGVLVDFWRLL